MVRFDPEIKKIENEIITYFLNSILGEGRSEITSTILFYFITRKELTQKNLQRLTGISAGKISQEVNDFVRMNLIKILNKSSTGEITYSMESIESEIFNRGINIIKSNLKWENKLLEIKREMEENQEKLHKLNGYEKIRINIEEHLVRFTGYKNLLKVWNEMEIKLKKNKKI
ncbi:MAG: hypothetical protein ACFFBP_05335 [Promethearchaeota archaeon]